MEEISKRLIELREAHGLNRVEMAKRIGINKSSITRYETNEIKPNLDVLIKIHVAFGVSLDWLAGIDTKEDIMYGKIIADCKESNIDPENLSEAVSFIKNTKRR